MPSEAPVTTAQGPHKGFVTGAVGRSLGVDLPVNEAKQAARGVGERPLDFRGCKKALRRPYLFPHGDAAHAANPVGTLPFAGNSDSSKTSVRFRQLAKSVVSSTSPPSRA